MRCVNKSYAVTIYRVSLTGFIVRLAAVERRDAMTCRTEPRTKRIAEKENNVGQLMEKLQSLQGQQAGSVCDSKRFVEEGAYVFITGRRQSELVKRSRSSAKRIDVQVKCRNLKTSILVVLLREKKCCDVIVASAGFVETVTLSKLRLSILTKRSDKRSRTFFTVQKVFRFFAIRSIVLVASCVSNMVFRCTPLLCD